MKRTTPLKRSPFRRKTEGPAFTVEEKPRAQRIAEQRPPRTLHRGVIGGQTVADPKSDAIQHAAYMAIVRTLPCEHCGRPGPSEFAHADMDKGQGIKSDCRMGTSLCPYRSPEDPGCHWLIGTKRIYPKAQRRELEAQMAARTRSKVEAMGKWPASLPRLAA